MKVLFERPGGAYLIETDPEKGEGFVFDGLYRYEPHLVDSILARGYWEDFTGDEDEVLRRVVSALPGPTADR